MAPTWTQTTDAASVWAVDPVSQVGNQLHYSGPAVDPVEQVVNQLHYSGSAVDPVTQVVNQLHYSGSAVDPVEQVVNLHLSDEKCAVLEI